MIIAKNIKKSYCDTDVLSDISFSIATGQKCALVGSNGVGKSTFLKIVAGLEDPTEGSVITSKNDCVGYLPQEIAMSDSDSLETIFHYVKKIAGILEIEKKMAELEKTLSQNKNIQEYCDIQQKYIHLGGYSFEHRMKTILSGFGLGDIGIERQLCSLSGGQKRKVALTAILLKGVDFLLLDEPTNDLDLPSLIWLEQFILSSQIGCLIVSHDRRFLDRVVRKVFEIDWFTRSINVFSGKYSEYLNEKERLLERQKDQYELQQKEIKKIKKTIRQKQDWGLRGATQTRPDNDKFSRGVIRDRASKSLKSGSAIEKRLEQMEKLEVPKQRNPFAIVLSPAGAESKHFIKLKDVIAGYKDFSIGPISLEVSFGARVGILGINGSGKSTFLKVITKKMLPSQGEVIIGESLVIGNLMQEHENLPREKNLFEFIKENTQKDDSAIFCLLSHFGFEQSEAFKQIGSLSPGGRARLLLAFFSAISANVLILDEPTNHLDVEASEALIEVLKTYTGTILLVSHDRFFIEQISLDNVFMMKDGLLAATDYEKYVISVQDEMKRLFKAL